ncbi:MAG: translation initiation factor IF-2 [Candidatus Berkelbacteria bacterium Licking1014_2]|uniref:Translation initiation factor IF-2 n=1 Tax=Candidatus Berkelbacteria bacterium Licking1014_2 TaxID=2017146 RepID=A0A554LW07_9BACT|nr:MAG: translation initiation factor IF-2 [Candidatus Berkelbacteria bacterium Licking1014_2]
MALTRWRPAKKTAKKELRRLAKKAYIASKPVHIKQKDIPSPTRLAIELPPAVSIRKLAEMTGRSVVEILQSLLNYGVIATLNESIDRETAAIIGDDLGFDIKSQSKEKAVTAKSKTPAAGRARPAVVTVMGHVDHGKTALLDKIRQTDVVAGESGGITQHIGAYQIKLKSKNEKGKIKEEIITFLDTPGHEAFSAMRAQGANVTDIVLLVVSAAEGVKPQTKEAISHAQAAGAPIIVAINKIDLPDADAEKIKRQLAELNLLVKDWGGEVLMAPVSAKTGQGIKELLAEIIKLAKKLNLKAPIDCPAQGVVIESHLHAGIGPLATVIITAGILHQGDILVSGLTGGKVRLMEDFNRKKIKEAGPGTPARIGGLKQVSEIGDILEAVADEQEAREIIFERRRQSQARKIVVRGIRELSAEIKTGQLKELNIILKTDVKGSEEAIINSLKSFQSPEVAVKVIASGVGKVSESDVSLAAASRGVILAFRVDADLAAQKMAVYRGIKISRYEIIYELLDEVAGVLVGLLPPEIIEEKQGRLKVKAIFRTEKDSGIIGGLVTEGFIQSGQIGKISRDKQPIGEIVIKSVQQNKRSVEKVEEGFECGLSYHCSAADKLKLAEDDIIELFKREEKKREIWNEKS